MLRQPLVDSKRRRDRLKAQKPLQPGSFARGFARKLWAISNLLFSGRDQTTARHNRPSVCRKPQRCHVTAMLLRRSGPAQVPLARCSIAVCFAPPRCRKESWPQSIFQRSHSVGCKESDALKGQHRTSLPIFFYNIHAARQIIKRLFGANWPQVGPKSRYAQKLRAKLILFGPTHFSIQVRAR